MPCNDLSSPIPSSVPVCDSCCYSSRSVTTNCAKPIKFRKTAPEAKERLSPNSTLPGKSHTGNYLSKRRFFRRFFIFVHSRPERSVTEAETGKLPFRTQPSINRKTRGGVSSPPASSIYSWLFHTGKTPVACSKARALRDAPLSLRQALPKTSPGLCRQNRDAAQTPGGLPDE